MKTNRIKRIALFAIVAAGTSAAFAANAYINQVGFRPSDPKEFSLVDASGNVEIVNASGQTVLTVTPSAASYWDPSGQNVQLVDISKLTAEGKYSIKVGGQVLRQDLVVKNNTFADVYKAAIKWFYYQRASMALESSYAGQWSRAAGHTNSTAEFHNSTGTSGTIQSSKGWYDAGDYGRYIVNSGITTYTLLSLYEHFPDFFKTAKWNIPAEGSLPDLLAEIKWNLDWMLTMQASDGTVYHKLTSLGFPGDVMPAQDNLKLYVIGKSAEAAFDFAGVMAVAARVYKPFDSNYANKCLEAAKKAEIYDDIMAMPDGFGSYTGERGVLLSGGQKQRVSIARIFLKNPPVLILDEATSALDTVTEARIQGAFDKLAEGRTTIVIAHRLSTIRNADRIILIDEGEIKEEGTHEELMKMGGQYASLYEVK